MRNADRGAEKRKKAAPKNGLIVVILVESDLEPSAGAALLDDLLPRRVPVEEILQSLHGGATLGLLEDARDGQHRIPVQPSLGEHGDGDLLLAPDELGPLAVHDQHAAIAGDPDEPMCDGPFSRRAVSISGATARPSS